MLGDPELSFVGRLGGAPELRFTPAGVAVASFSVAAQSRKKNALTGEYEDDVTTWLRCTVWREAAEHCAETLLAGDRVMVTGYLRQRSYDTPEGDKRTVFDVDVREVGPTLRFVSARLHRPARTSELAQAGELVTAGAAAGDTPPF